jgi:hypothetical protein
MPPKKAATKGAKGKAKAVEKAAVKVTKVTKAADKGKFFWRNFLGRVKFGIFGLFGLFL